MIISKEQLDITDPITGQPSKKILISYTDKQGQIAFTQWDLPSSEMYKWVYTSKAKQDPPFMVTDPYTGKPVIDPTTGQPKYAQWRSFMNKPIRKAPCKQLDAYRINECINYWGEPLQIINELNLPDTWYCDIETDVTLDGFPDPQTAKNHINTIAITKFPQTIVFGRKQLTPKEQQSIQKKLENYSHLTKGYQFEYRYFSTEREMIESFLDFITPIAAVSGWNFLGYDWLYICNRCELLGINYKRVSPTKKFTKFKLNRKAKVECMVPMHKIVYDYMIVYQLWDQTVQIRENDTLDYVANAVLGVQKVNHPWGFIEFYAEHYEDYVFYNAVDTILVEKINDKIQTAKVWCMLASELKCDLYAAFSTITPAETVMTNFLYPEYKILVKDEEEKEAVDYEGAFVWPTQPGIYKYIGGLDFASLYPSIIREFLISPDSYKFKDINHIPAADEIKCSSGAVFKKDKDALIPRILDTYFAKRKQAKVNKKICLQKYEDYLHIYRQRTNNI